MHYQIHNVLRLLVTANLPSSPILVTLMMEALLSSETSVLTSATQLNILVDGILPNRLLPRAISPDKAAGA
jgi:hypothetical protein